MLRPTTLVAVVLTAVLLVGTREARCQGGTGGGGGGAGTGGGVGGVLIDPEGVLQPMKVVPGLKSRRPADKNETPSGTVCVSLRRLNELLTQAKPGAMPPEAFVLGGLIQIDQIVVSPDERDVFLIGPGDAQAAGDAPSYLGGSTGRPLMRTGDFLVMLAGAQRGRFEVRCSIDPEPSRLKAYNDHIQASAGRVTFANAAAWYGGLAKILGRQNVTLGGIPQDSRVGNVLAAADYSMKRIALGLEQSGVRAIQPQLAYAGGDLGVTMKRWWFAPNYEDVSVNPPRTVFAIGGPRVRLVAQEELVQPDGQRIDAASNRPSTEAFARQFTEHFDELTLVRPIFLELKQQYDLAIVATLLTRERLLPRFEISLTPDTDAMAQLAPACAAPKFVESGANLRRANRTTIVGVVGGVEIPAGSIVQRERVQTLPVPAVAVPSDLPANRFSWGYAGAPQSQ